MLHDDRTAPWYVPHLRTGATLALLAALAVIVLVGVYGRSDFWLIALPGYLTGIGTLAAAAAAVGIAVQTNRREETRRDRERMQAAATDAAKVLALCAIDAVPARQGVAIHNLSANPIRDVKLLSGQQETGEGSPPDPWYWEFGNGHGTSFVPVVRPGDCWSAGGRWRTRDEPAIQADDYGNVTARRPPNYVTGWLTATIRWTDTGGQTWTRTGRAAPEPTGPASSGAP